MKCFLVALCACLWFGIAGAQESLLQQADEAYHSGERASTIAEREAAFNRALLLYTELEEKNHPVYGNGKLYFNIGNSYFQLGQYPLAIVYYYRALALDPRSETIANNLHLAQAKLGINVSEETSLFDKLFFFHTKFSLPERLQALFVLGLVLLLLLSFYLWRGSHGIKTAIKWIGCAWLLMLLSVGYTRYFSPVEAVVVDPTVLYRDAGEQYAKVSDQPVLPGSKVRIIDSSQEGNWLKVITSQGTVGYLLSAKAQIILPN